MTYVLDIITLVLLLGMVLSFLFFFTTALALGIANYPTKLPEFFRIKLISHSFILVVLIFTLGFACKALLSYSARYEISSFADEFDSKRDSVFVNDKLFAKPETLLQQLKNIQVELPNNRSPVSNDMDVKILISNNETHIFLRGGDQDPNIYWVYYPKYKITNDNNIGQFESNLLDSI